VVVKLRVTCRIHDGLVLLRCDSLAGAVGSEESDIIVFVQLSYAESGWHRSVHVKLAHD
jgi:hypothetical protein